MSRIIECVPNFSEGRDKATLQAIAQAVESVDGVKLLDMDPGAATHRTVFTFAGEPEAVVEAAVRAAKAGVERIDMGKHSGEHPRFGALDVCPLVPIAGVTMEETVEHARTLARRLGEEVGLTIYCYEEAALRPARKNLADVRAGEYEGLAAKLGDPEWAPDFGPAAFQPRSGATAVGARDFLVAYNVNLNTTSVKLANQVACDVREKGRVKRDAAGQVVRGADGAKLREPGSLKQVKGIGWFIEEYGVAQISMNLTNISVTPVHVAFDEVVKKSAERGMRVTGSELVGLVPLRSMLEAGRHYLTKQQRSIGVSDAELIKIAVKSMGLDELAPFHPEEKIIEYVLAKGAPARLADLSLRGFVEETASESMAPGGGSVAAALAALGAGLGTMVANLSAEKKGWEERWERFSAVADQGKRLADEAVALIDRDTDAFNGIIAARRMPKGTDAEQAARADAIEAATCGAIDVPFRAMEVGCAAFDVLEAMAEEGNPASISDVGVGALCARSAVLGAHLNVRINVGDLASEETRRDYLARAQELADRAVERERQVLAAVDAKL
jgi:glutamate formiminotransferase/formiminotetrahydrofolate cyclodeaminase